MREAINVAGTMNIIDKHVLAICIRYRGARACMGAEWVARFLRQPEIASHLEGVRVRRSASFCRPWEDALLEGVALPLPPPPAPSGEGTGGAGLAGEPGGVLGKPLASICLRA